MTLGAGGRRAARSCGRAFPWVVLLVVSAVMILSEAIPVAGPSAPLAASVATLAGVVGLVLLYLGVVRFLAFGRALDLFLGIGFGALALANLAVRLATLALAPEATWVAAPMLLLLLRTVSAVLFLVPLARPGREVEGERRIRYAVEVGGATALITLLGCVGVIAAGEVLPPPVEPSTRRLLEADVVVVRFLPGQAWWLLLANGALALVMLVVTVGYVRWARRASEPYLTAVAAALALLSLAQFHTLFFPTVALDYVSTAALFRLVAYLVMVVSLTIQVGRDMVERAGRDERVRLSRDLHDGLMQHLSLLNLRLQRARSPRRAEAARAGDLDASVRALEAAMIEARQVIVAQRTGVVGWDGFTQSVRHVAGVFEANYGVAIVVRADPTGPTLGISVQADVLRIVHEACSNAVRHGAADRIEVSLAADTDHMDLRVRDDGAGFDPDRGRDGSGLGLRSMRERAERWGSTCSIESVTGRGTAIQVLFPLDPRRSAGA
jgi:signal transduction histidine kinase